MAPPKKLVARVGEGIVTTIGSADNHMEVLENPNRISKMVLERGLDAGTAFEILSIDIADMDVGDNVGARLKIDQAEADKQVAQRRPNASVPWRWRESRRWWRLCRRIGPRLCSPRRKCP